MALQALTSCPSYCCWWRCRRSLHAPHIVAGGGAAGARALTLRRCCCCHRHSLCDPPVLLSMPQGTCSLTLRCYYYCCCHRRSRHDPLEALRNLPTLPNRPPIDRKAFERWGAGGGAYPRIHATMPARAVQCIGASQLCCTAMGAIVCVQRLEGLRYLWCVMALRRAPQMCIAGQIIPSICGTQG